MRLQDLRAPFPVGSTHPEIVLDEEAAMSRKYRNLGPETLELVETAQERVEFKVPRVLREPVAG